MSWLDAPTDGRQVGGKRLRRPRGEILQRQLLFLVFILLVWVAPTSFAANDQRQAKEREQKADARHRQESRMMRRREKEKKREAILFNTTPPVYWMGRF